MGVVWDLLMGVAAPVFLGVGVGVASLFLLGAGCAAAFAASVNDLNPALITCVANISLSFADRPSAAASFAFVRVLAFAGGRLVVFFVAAAVEDGALGSGISRSRSVTVVADVQVVVDATAAFTASAFVVRVVIGAL